MDANLVADWRWTKYQIKLFTISQLQLYYIWIHAAGYNKKLLACTTAKILTAFLILHKQTITNVFNNVNTDGLIISLLNTVIENNYGLENRMWRQTNGWVTCAKPSRQNTDPGVSHTFSRRFLNQNYPKYISDVVSKIREEKNYYQMFYLNLWSS